MSADTGDYVGRVWSSSIGGEIGSDLDAPTPAQSFDELAIVMKRAAGLRFDERLPNFHLYGTDIVQAALSAGHGAYVATLPLVHNDTYKDQLREDFMSAYRWMQRKWRDRLPLSTTVGSITWHGLNMRVERLRWSRSVAKRLRVALPTEVDPRSYSARCGWE
ncbi:MAG: hypothetical protein N2422_03820 [Rhodobacteraceae bacterium]|nr:hypothetical protein [Paracoccaceae bacterium]